MSRLSAPEANRDQLIRWRDRYRSGLLEDVVPFWLEHAIDSETGGFLTCLDRDGTVIDTDKSVWQQGRFAWLLAKLYNDLDARDEWRLAAQSGVRFIQSFGFDPDDGRLWFHLTREGKPIRKRRYAFSESFAAIAFGEMAKLSGDSRMAAKASDLFQTFWNHNVEPDRSTAKFTDVRPSLSIGFPMIGLMTAQELRDSIELHEADRLIDECIHRIRDQFVKPEIECVMETVDQDGGLIDHFDGRTLNPGHAIEGAWFILREAKRRNDPQLVALGTNMLDWMWERGWDTEFGGMLYFVSVDDRPIQEYWHDMKFWWPQNETLIATLLAYQLTGVEKYILWHAQLHDWVYSHFPDPEYGEWFGYLHRDGRISSTIKGNMWKGPFHIPRMQYTCWQILDELLSRDQSASAST